MTLKRVNCLGRSEEAYSKCLKWWPFALPRTCSHARQFVTGCL